MDSIVNRGNWKRLKECMLRARSGQRITIGYIGGSITMGSLATTSEKCYAYLSYKWWKDTFKNAEVIYQNAGIGATTSQFGAARIIDDLLSKNPDVIFVEYSVNDDNTKFYQETYEGLVRLTYQSNTKPAVILLHNAFFSDGVSAEEIHSEVGRYYSLPCISLKNSIYEKIKSGLYEETDISCDHLHPNDFGHELIAETIRGFLNKVYKECDAIERAAVFPQEPLTSNRYENTICYHNHEMEDITLNGFRKDTEKQIHITDVFKRGWFSYHKGDSLEFDICAKTLAIQYRKTMKYPAPTASVIVDGNIEQAVVLDAQFDETWGDLLCIENIFVNNIQAKHHIKIELAKTYDLEEIPFYIVSIIVS